MPRAPDVPLLLGRLGRLLESVWEEGGRRLPGGVEPHRVRFSRRITESWALIYYRRREVRLSPYVFLVDPAKLHGRSDWQELASSVLHEVAHAHLWAQTRDPGHPPEFATRLRRLGVDPNGACDLGPENPAYRYRYACPTCAKDFLRRTPLRGASSCGVCGPGAYTPRHRLRLAETLANPWDRLAHAAPRIERAIAQGERATRAYAGERERALVVDPRLTVRRLGRTR